MCRLRLDVFGKNENFRLICVIGLFSIFLTGFYFGFPRALHTEIFPVFTVISGSMCIPAEECTPFSHVFERTLHVGDLIVIQGVDAKDLKTDYPNSDIIVFRDPTKAVNDPDANIVHRIVDVVKVNGTLYFHTKGDGNNYPNVWPETPQSVDRWYSTADDPTSTYEYAISQDYIYGKVVMRIPWAGSLGMFFQQHNIIWGILVLITILFVICGFILPAVKKENKSSRMMAKETTN